LNDAPRVDTSLDLRDLLGVLRRRRWLAIVPFGVATLAGLALALALPPVYTSTVTLLFEKPQSLGGGLGDVGGGATDPGSQADVMREQVKSSLFLRSVITATGIATDAHTRAWALKSASHYPGVSRDEAVDLFLIDHLRGAVSIRRAKGAVFEVAVEDFEKDRAQVLAGGVANQFIASSKAAQIEAVRATQEFSLEQERLYKRRAEESEERLQAFREHQLGESMANSSISSMNLQRAHSLLDQASFEWEDAKQRVQTLRQQCTAQGQPNDPELLTSASAAALAAQIVALERQVASSTLSDAGQENQGAVRLGIIRKRGELETELTAGADRAFGSKPDDFRHNLVEYRLALADLAGIEARRTWLSAQITTYERSVIVTPERTQEEARLVQEAEANRNMYNQFLQQSALASINEAFENAKLSGKFDLIEPATRPLQPSKPNRPVLIVLSMIAGTIVGIATVLLVEHHDHSVRNADEIESLLGLPVLGTVPRVVELERGRRRGRPAAAGPGTPGARDHGLLHRLKVESPLGLEFRRSTLKLQRLKNGGPPHTLLVTSSTRGEGKTTTTACLAITLARELHQKVLLVDFDLRSPALHRALGLPSSSWGLAQILSQRQFDERFVRATVMPDLEFLPAGKAERPPSELISNDAVEWFVREAASRYPLVVIDSAPNLAVPDSLIIGRVVDGVIFVIKAGSTVRKAAEYGVRVQREARDNVIGVLLNDAGEVLPQYYGYRYNYYGYTDQAAGTDA
jgi:capsular exopolysaccharide synthesis family protein